MRRAIQQENPWRPIPSQAIDTRASLSGIAHDEAIGDAAVDDVERQHVGRSAHRQVTKPGLAVDANPADFQARRGFFRIPGRTARSGRHRGSGPARAALPPPSL